MNPGSLAVLACHLERAYQLAVEHGHPFLAYLIGMALQVARERAQAH